MKELASLLSPASSAVIIDAVQRMVGEKNQHLASISEYIDRSLGLLK